MGKNRVSNCGNYATVPGLMVICLCLKRSYGYGYGKRGKSEICNDRIQNSMNEKEARELYSRRRDAASKRKKRAASLIHAHPTFI